MVLVISKTVQLIIPKFIQLCLWQNKGSPFKLFPSNTVVSLCLLKCPVPTIEGDNKKLRPPLTEGCWKLFLEKPAKKMRWRPS